MGSERVGGRHEGPLQIPPVVDITERLTNAAERGVDDCATSLWPPVLNQNRVDPSWRASVIDSSISDVAMTDSVSPTTTNSRISISSLLCLSVAVDCVVEVSRENSVDAGRRFGSLPESELERRPALEDESRFRLIQLCGHRRDALDGLAPRSPEIQVVDVTCQLRASSRAVDLCLAHGG